MKHFITLLLSFLIGQHIEAQELSLTKSSKFLGDYKPDSASHFVNHHYKLFTQKQLLKPISFGYLNDYEFKVFNTAQFLVNDENNPVPLFNAQQFPVPYHLKTEEFVIVKKRKRSKK